MDQDLRIQNPDYQYHHGSFKLRNKPPLSDKEQSIQEEETNAVKGETKQN